MVEYAYDAWGKPLSKTGTMANTLGALNPFRYRGYVYDEETGLYYLRSRYYNLVWGRFVNGDSAVGQLRKLLSHNLYAYCSNNPIIGTDPSGKVVFFIAMCLALVAIAIVDQRIATIPGPNDSERNLARAYPLKANKAKQLSDSASALTDVYWGQNATDYDATLANAFKHAVWNALMVRDMGYDMANKFATAHEAEYYGDNGPYELWYNKVTITLHQATVMDLNNNERGRAIGQNIPFYYSDDQVAQVVLEDMDLNPGKYSVIIWDYCNAPIK